MAGAVLGIDLGGTNIAAGLVDDEHRVRERDKRKTPKAGPDAVVEAIVALVEATGADVEAVGIGVPGPVSDGIVLTAPNLPGWTEPVALRDRLSRSLDLRVAVGNDATVGAVGEWITGAGRGSTNLLGVWLGTGVGGGLVLDGRPFDGAFGAAGELGHVVVRPGGALCGCGRRGCLEAYAGRGSMERAARTRIDAGEASALLAIMDDKGKSRMTSSVWARAYGEGDALAVRALDEAVEALGIAIGSAINLLDLDTVVVGGGVTEKLGQPLVDRIAAAARPVLLLPAAQRRFVVAALGDDSGIVGAAQLARTSGR